MERLNIKYIRDCWQAGYNRIIDYFKSMHAANITNYKILFFDRLKNCFDAYCPEVVLSARFGKATAGYGRLQRMAAA